MYIQIASIVVLAVMFILATVLPVNMGALAFAGAFIIALLAHLNPKDIFDGFPGDLFVTLVGITYLFAIAQNNGTIDWLVRKAVWLVRGRIAAIPWVMFIAAGLLTGVGAVSPAAVAIIAPIALSFAYKHGISPLLMGLMVIHGAQAGGFSPISIYGGITNQVIERAGLPRDAITLFLASLMFNTAVAILLFIMFSAHRLRRSNEQEIYAVSENKIPHLQAAFLENGGTAIAVESLPTTDAESDNRKMPLNTYRAITLIGLIVLAIGSLVFQLNVGLLAISVAVVLSLLAPEAQKQSLDQIRWSTVLLITGVVTYIGVLQKIGAVDLVGNSVSGIGAPLLGALLLCYIGGIVSAFASSVAVLGATIPLAVPFLLQGHLSAVGVVAAIAVSSTIVDVSPFSTNGALVVSNAQGVNYDRFYRQMLAYSALVVVLGPLLVWLLLVFPGWL
jgi:di/tricarboxylate transporter